LNIQCSMVDYGSGMLKRKRKRNTRKKGDTINVMNSTTPQLYLVSRYEQHTYQQSTMYVCIGALPKEKRSKKKKKEKTKEKEEWVGSRGSSQRSVRLDSV